MNLDTGPSGIVSPLVVPAIVALPAEVDITNTPQIGDELCAAFGAGAAVVIADLTRTVFCDSSGIRYLLIAQDAGVMSGAELRLVIPSAAVLRAFRLTGVDQVLRIYPSLQAALTNPPAEDREAGFSPDGSSPANEASA